MQFNKDGSLESSEQHLQYSPHDTQNAGDDHTPPPPYNNSRSAESNEHALDNLVESDIEEIEIDEEDEIKNLTEVFWYLLYFMYSNYLHSYLISQDEIEVRNKIIKVLVRCQDKEKNRKNLT